MSTDTPAPSSNRTDARDQRRLVDTVQAPRAFGVGTARRLSIGSEPERAVTQTAEGHPGSPGALASSKFYGFHKSNFLFVFLCQRVVVPALLLILEAGLLKLRFQRRILIAQRSDLALQSAVLVAGKLKPSTLDRVYWHALQPIKKYVKQAHAKRMTGTSTPVNGGGDQ